MLDPRTLAKMLDALDIQGTIWCSISAAAHGYSAAVIARMAEAVVGVEEDEAPGRGGAALLEHGADNVMVQQGRSGRRCAGSRAL